MAEAAIMQSGAKEREDERKRMKAWSVNDVADHMRSLGCPEQAKIFTEEVRFCILNKFLNQKRCVRTKITKSLKESR